MPETTPPLSGFSEPTEPQRLPAFEKVQADGIGSVKRGVDDPKVSRSRADSIDSPKFPKLSRLEGRACLLIGRLPGSKRAAALMQNLTKARETLAPHLASAPPHRPIEQGEGELDTLFNQGKYEELARKLVSDPADTDALRKYLPLLQTVAGGKEILLKAVKEMELAHERQVAFALIAQRGSPEMIRQYMADIPNADALLDEALTEFVNFDTLHHTGQLEELKQAIAISPFLNDSDRAEYLKLLENR